MGKVRLTESQLKNIVSECTMQYLQEMVQNGELDEGIFDKLGFLGRKAGQGVKNTATNVGQGVKNAATSVGQGIKNAATKAGRGVMNAAQKVGQGVSDAYAQGKEKYNQTRDAMNQYSQAMDQKRAAKANMNKIPKYINVLKDMAESGVFDGISYGNKAKDAIQKLIITLGKVESGWKGNATAFGNEAGAM